MKKMNKNCIGRFVRGIYLGITTLIIVLGSVLAVLYLCGIRLYSVRSGSMGDSVPLGSLCLVSTYTSYDSIRSGDIISFRLEDDMFVTHRADDITEKGIITKGDCNENADPEPVTKENYIGKTIFAVPYLGKLFSWLNTIKGMAVLIIFVAVIIFLPYFFRSANDSIIE